MHDAPRVSRTATIVLVWVALTGAVVAQGPFAASYAGDERGAVVVAAIQAALADDDGDVGAAVAEITAELYRSVTSGTSSAPPNDHDVCAYLVGTGGTKPRLDGGGDLLSVRGQGWDGVATIVRSTYRIDGFSDGATIVIIDDFNLEAIAVSILARISARESVVVDATTLDNDLWTALVGYRFDLQGETDPANAFVPHGHVVAFHALTYLPTGSRITAVSMPSDGRVELTVEHELEGVKQTMTVHLLDIDFDDVATIQTAMDETGDFPDAVVVMSWGLVDCFLAGAYGGGDPYESLAEYVADRLLGSADTESLLRDLCVAIERILAERGDGDLVRSCEDQSPEEIAVLGPLAYFAGLIERSAEAVTLPDELQGQSYFAAAGNQGLGFPMPPAAWSGIHAVEACTLGEAPSGSPTPASFTNAATLADDPFGAEPLAALGAWFWTPERLSTSDAVLGYWGTSFAAPAAAVQFLQGGLPGGPFVPCGGLK